MVATLPHFCGIERALRFGWDMDLYGPQGEVDPDGESYKALRIDIVNDSITDKFSGR